MRYALLLALGLAWFLPTPAHSETAPDSGMMLAQTKKPKKGKKKKKSSDEEGFGVDGLEAVTDDSGTGVHREQEGVDTPYKAEAAMSFNVSLLSNQVGDADATNSTVIDLNVEWLAIVGPFGIGPDIGYSSRSSKEKVTTKDATGKEISSDEVENKDSSYRVGGVFKFYFANVDKADLVPFAYAGVAYLGNESKYGDAEAQKSSGLAFRVGGGLNLFLDSNIAFNPRAEYYMATLKTDGEDAVEIKEGGLKILVGIAVFI
jgi:hypothetical protein